MTKTSGRKLSELEGVCLGIVYRRQPCTAYRVRLDLKEAPSSHWRASAGSVYPLLARLENEGLVTTMTDADDGRWRKLFKVMAKGRKALGNWVNAGADPEIISSVTDPIRSRTFFLDVLGSSEQLDYLRRTIALTESYLIETKARLQKSSNDDNRYDHLGALGAVKINEARLDWLKQVYKELSTS